MGRQAFRPSLLLRLYCCIATAAPAAALLHCCIAALLHCCIAALLHCCIAALLHCCIAALLHCCIAALLHCCIAALLHCCIAALLHCCIAALLHCCIAALLHCCIAALLHCCIAALLHCCIAALLHCCIAALLHCCIAALLHCCIAALLHCCIAALLHCCIAALLHCCIAALLHCCIAALLLLLLLLLLLRRDGRADVVIPVVAAGMPCLLMLIPLCLSLLPCRYLAGGPEDCLKHFVLVALLRRFVKKSCSVAHQQLKVAISWTFHKLSLFFASFYGLPGHPFTYIDAHAGSGLYDLKSDESQVFCNHEDGIVHIMNGVRKQVVSGAVYQLMHSTLEKRNAALKNPGFQHYLGSAAWALEWLRHQDQAATFEISSIFKGCMFFNEPQAACMM